MFTPCEAARQPAQPVLSIRTHSRVEDLPALIGKSYGGIMAYLQELGEQPAGMPFVAYYSLDMQNLDIEIGFPVAKALAGKGEVQPSEVPEGLFASNLYTGPYEQMPPAYEALTEFVKANGYEPTGVAYEYYLNGPMDTTPEGLQTRIVFPLKG
jgi:effector-binding domain-containing protein